MDGLIVKYYDEYMEDGKYYYIEKNILDGTSHMHNHQFVELELLIEGSGTQTINGTSHKIFPGYVSILTPSDFHSYTLSDGVNLEILSIKFNPDFISEDIRKMILNRRSAVILNLSEESRNKIEGLGDVIFVKSAFNDKFTSIIVRNCIECICSIILEEYTKTGAYSADDSVDDKCQKALSYIHLNFKQKLSLEDVASHIHMTPTYFCTYFRQQTGTSFVNYINKLRVHLAYDLITQTDMTLTQIYYESGFKSYTHFSKIFKEFYNHSPGYFRTGDIDGKTENENGIT